MENRVTANCGRGEQWWYALLLTGLLLSAGAIVFMTLFGHAHEFRVPWEPPWGLFITTYEFFALCGAGMALLAGLLRFAGVPGFPGLGQRGVPMAALALAIGVGLVVIELTQPTRLSLNPVWGEELKVSMLVAGTCFGLALLIMPLLSRMLSKDCLGCALALGAGGFVLSLAGVYGMGSVLASFGHSPEWLDAGFWIVYPAVAILSGMALFTLLLFLNYRLMGVPISEYHRPLLARLGRRMLLWIVLTGILLAVELLGGILSFGEPRRLAAEFLLFGPLAPSFWLFQVGVGMVIPVALLWRKTVTNPCRVVLAAALVLVGQFFRSFDLAIAKQLAVVKVDATFLFEEGLLTIAPCLPKLLVVVGSLCLFFFLFSLGEKYIPREKVSR